MAADVIRNLDTNLADGIFWKWSPKFIRFKNWDHRKLKLPFLRRFTLPIDNVLGFLSLL